MADWLSYRPEDFLLFGPEVYWRLFALQNMAAWPLQPVTLLLGLAMLALLLRPGAGATGRPGAWPGRALCCGLAALWLHTGWSFLLQLYAPVNWAVEHAVPLFALQAALLLGLAAGPGGIRGPASSWPPRRIAGAALLLLAVVVYPLLALLAGRPWREAEIFGIAPDPTAIGTLGFLLAAVPGWPGALALAVPLAWCLASAAVLLTLGGWDGWLPLAAAVLALAARLAPADGRPGAA